MNNNSIGLFDSGLGGLTVLSEIKSILPNENYIYFGDTARVPYGSKSKETIIEYSRQIISFLISKGVKLIVIACGTASSLAFDTVKDEFDVPIINVITPTAKSIKSSRIGVIATSATIKSNAWKKEILKYNSTAHVTSKACPLFVPIVEEGLVNTQVASDAINLYLKSYKNNVDSLVLGCTHYPILIDKINSYFNGKIKLVNINKACAKEVYSYLKSHKLFNDSKKEGSMVAYTTDSTVTFKKNAKKFCNCSFKAIKKVSL
jgi:glutamate racemase